MIHCQLCNRSMTTIEAANCKQADCAVRDKVISGVPPKPRDFPKRRPTDPNAAVGGEYDRIGSIEKRRPGLTKRELFALEAMKCRLTNEDMYKRHGCQYDAVASDAVKWADALIDRLNGVTPELGP